VEDNLIATRTIKITEEMIITWEVRVKIEVIREKEVFNKRWEIWIVEEAKAKSETSRIKITMWELNSNNNSIILISKDISTHLSNLT